MITHVREMITGHFDGQNMDDKDEKGMEKDSYSYGCSNVHVERNKGTTT